MTRTEFKQAYRAARLAFRGHPIAAAAQFKRCQIPTLMLAYRCINTGPRLFGLQASECARKAGRSRSHAITLNLRAARWRRYTHFTGWNVQLPASRSVTLQMAGH